MGGIIGGIVGGVGSYLGAREQAHAADLASQRALTGYRYLSSNPTAWVAEQQGQQAGDQRAGLLGLGTPDQQAAAQQGFQNFLGNSGYNFDLNQGLGRINAGQAASGMLNSGATLKALQNYGQGLNQKYFTNYLGQLGTVQGVGQNDMLATGSAGSTGGGNAVRPTMGAGDAMSTGTNNMLGQFTNAGTQYASSQGWL